MLDFRTGKALKRHGNIVLEIFNFTAPVEKPDNYMKEHFIEITFRNGRFDKLNTSISSKSHYNTILLDNINDQINIIKKAKMKEATRREEINALV